MTIYQTKMLTSTDKHIAGRHIAFCWLTNNVSQFEERGGKEDCQTGLRSTEQTRVARKVRKHHDLNSTQTTGHPIHSPIVTIK